MSIKLKVALWYALLMLVILITAMGFVFYTGTKMTNEAHREMLDMVVNDVVEEIKSPAKQNEKGQNGKEKGKKRKEEAQDEAVATLEPDATSEAKKDEPPVERPNGPHHEDETASDPEGGGLNRILNIDTYKDGVYISVYDSAGELIVGLMPSVLSEEVLPAFKKDSLQEHNYENESWLIYDEQVENSKLGMLTVRGITSVSEDNKEIQNMIMVALIAIPIIIILAVAVGYWLTKRAFKPVKQINDTAQAISDSGDLSMRINLGEGKDEIYTLANTVDGMFNRLQKAFENEKQFTSDASHELRTPVSVIISQCEYSIENAETVEEAKDGLKVILKKATKMSAMISQLLMLARADKGHQKLNKENFNIAELMVAVVEEKQLAAQEKDIEISIKTEEEMNINADETMIMRMFINLLDNAIQYTEAGGKIEVGLTQNESEIIGFVSDNGIGISEEDLSHIWERFYRADKSRSDSGSNATGLGLPMVKWIVTAHGGTINVRSTLGEGTTFMFTLPILKK